jgi:hypothetical protein
VIEAQDSHFEDLQANAVPISGINNDKSLNLLVNFSLGPTFPTGLALSSSLWPPLSPGGSAHNTLETYPKISIADLTSEAPWGKRKSLRNTKESVYLAPPELWREMDSVIYHWSVLVSNLRKEATNWGQKTPLSWYDLVIMWCLLRSSSEAGGDWGICACSVAAEPNEVRPRSLVMVSIGAAV